MHPEIERYFTDYVIDQRRKTTKKCMKEGLPYVDMHTGKLYNTACFSQAALNFQKNGTYTHHPPKSEPWFNFWRQERKRIREGLWLGQVRVTGYHYFMLNYHRMKIAIDGEEQEGFGSFMRLQFFLFHLLDYADYTKQNFAFIKLRSCGASECAAAIGEADCLVPPIKVQNGHSKKQMPSNAYFASDTDYLGGDDGIFTKMTRSITWLCNHTDKGIYEPFAINSSGKTMHWMVGTRDNNNKPVQTGGEVIARVVKIADEARAGRKRRVFFEESGANKNLGSSMGVVESNLKRLADKTGIQVVWGTSNEKADGIRAFKEVLQNPRGVYQTIAFRNVWKELKKGEEGFAYIPWNPFEYMLHPSENEKGAVGYFIPAYELRIRDEHGNPDRLEGYRFIQKQRKELRENVGTDQRGLLAFIADNPIFMEEALLVSKGKLFNHDGLANQLVKLDTGLIQDPVIRGNMEFEKSKKHEIVGVRFWENPQGNVKILEMPSWAVKEGNSWYVDIHSPKAWHKYIGGIDGVDQGTLDSSGGGSNMACLIKKRRNEEDGALSDGFANCYIALYNHRSADDRDDKENVFKMLLFFNAQALLEYTKKSIKDYIVKEKKSPKYLAVEPSAPGETNANFRRNIHRKGLRATKDVIDYYIEKIREYIHDYYQFIMFKEFVAELLDYTYEEKGDYDLVAAMGMCEVLTAELRDTSIYDESKKKEPVLNPSLGWHVDPITGKRYFGVDKKDPDIQVERERQVAYYDKTKEATKNVIYTDEIKKR